MTDASLMLVEAYKYKSWADGRTIDAVRRVSPESAPSALLFLSTNHLRFNVNKKGG